MTQLLLPAVRSSPISANDNRSRTSSVSKGSPTKTTATEPLSRAIRSAGNLVHYLRGGLSQTDRHGATLLEERKQILSARLQHAETWQQWDKAAHELDELEGNEEWKKDNSTGDYDPELIQERLEALDEARTNCDLRAMMHLVRTALTRDLGGMGNLDLYRHSYCGTKKLIEKYVESTLRTIGAVVEQSSRPLPDGLVPKDLLDAMLYARQSFGRSALLLSGGGTFGMTHIGVLKAMFEVKLLPRIISGASAGSIVCSVVCTRTDEEIPQVLSEFPHGDLAVFEEEGNEDGLLAHLRRLFTEGNWSDIKHLTRVMRDLLGDMTFQEAYNRTRRICNICVSSASIYELPRLLNYVTSPNVMIWSAVAASCSVPLVFSAAPLLVKDPATGRHSPWNPTPQMWIDGSVDNDLPMTRLAEMFNVNHFIVSQVNPHVVPFLSNEDAPYSASEARSQSSGGQAEWIYTVAQLAKSEALHRLQIIAELGIFPNLVTKVRSILSQKYSGDINILPAMGVLDLPKILANPTSDFMHRSCLSGERATWPKLSRVRDRCAIELALDRAVHALKARVVFSKSQADLRRMMTGTIANTMGGSHEPLNAMISPMESLMIAKEKLKRRHRRSSGSNLQPVLALRKHVHEADEVTDDVTDQEERLEMVLKRARAKPKLRMKRLPPHDHLQTGPKTAPHLGSSDEPNAFDFAKSPPSTSRDTDRFTVRASMPAAAPPYLESMHIDAKLDDNALVNEASSTSTGQQTAQPDELATSDAHASDADIDSVSDSSIENVDMKSSNRVVSNVREKDLQRRGEMEPPTISIKEP
ncbi:Lipase 4-like protein 1 [Seiridium cupressi]